MAARRPRRRCACRRWSGLWTFLPGAVLGSRPLPARRARRSPARPRAPRRRGPAAWRHAGRVEPCQERTPAPCFRVLAKPLVVPQGLVARLVEIDGLHEDLDGAPTGET